MSASPMPAGPCKKGPKNSFTLIIGMVCLISVQAAYDPNKKARARHEEFLMEDAPTAAEEMENTCATADTKALH